VFLWSQFTIRKPLNVFAWKNLQIIKLCRERCQVFVSMVKRIRGSVDKVASPGQERGSGLSVGSDPKSSTRLGTVLVALIGVHVLGIYAIRLL